MTTSKAKRPKKGLGRGLSALISANKPVPAKPPKAADDKTQKAKQPSTTQQKSITQQQGPTAQTVQGNIALDTTPSPSQTGGSGFTERIRYIDIEAIRPNPKQPRQTFLEAEIKELSDSIKTLGVLSPVLIRPATSSTSDSTSGKGSYEIVAGERRWRAAKDAGLSQLPVIIREFDDRETLEISIVENVQRSDLSPLEEALAYQRLIDEFSLSQREVAEKVGKDRTSVANFLRLLKLPKQIQEMLSSEKITMGHAKAILTVKEPTAQLSLAKKVIAEGLSVRALEAIVSRVVVLPNNRDERQSSKKGNKGSTEQSFPEVLDRMRKSLATKVHIKHHPSGRGRIEIEYFSEAELDRLIDKICDQ